MQLRDSHRPSSHQPSSHRPYEQPSKRLPRPPATVQAARAAQAAKQAAAQEAELESSVLFGSVRRQRAPVRDDEIRCGLHPAVLKSNLDVAWEPGRGGCAEAERAEASRAAQAQYDEKQRAAIAARKESAKRARGETVHGGPCLCTPEGALEAIREERREWQTALDQAVKVAKGATFLARWLTQDKAASAAE